MNESEAEPLIWLQDVHIFRASSNSTNNNHQYQWTVSNPDLPSSHGASTADKEILLTDISNCTVFDNNVYFDFASANIFAADKLSVNRTDPNKCFITKDVTVLPLSSYEDSG